MSISSPVLSEVWLEHVWDEHASNVMHVLTVADSPKDIEVLNFKGLPPELEIPSDNELSLTRIPALKDTKTGSYAKTAADSIAEDYGYVSAPTPDGKAVLLDIYLDQALILDKFGNKYARWSLPSGTFAKLISATSDTEYLWILYWESADFNGSNSFRFEQRLLIDGSLVHYEVTDGISSEVQFYEEILAVNSESILIERYPIFSETLLTTHEAVESLVDLSEIDTNSVSGEVDLLLDYAVDSEVLLDIADLYLLSETELLFTEILTGVSSEVEYGDLARSFVNSTPELLGTLGSGEGVSSEVDLSGVEVHAWVTITQRNSVCRSQAGQPWYWSFVGDEDNPISSYLEDVDLLDNEAFYNYYFYTGQPGLDRHIRFGDEQDGDPNFTGSYLMTSPISHTRPITSPAIQASESNLYVINTFDRKNLNFRDTTQPEGDPDRRTSKSVLYRFDKDTRTPLKAIKPAVVSMSCAYGRAATDALGLILADTFIPAEYSFPYAASCLWAFPVELTTEGRLNPADHFFKEGDLLIYDEHFNLIYDEPMAFPILASDYITAMQMRIFADDTLPRDFYPLGDTPSQTIRQFSTVLAYGNYIVTAVSVEYREAWLKDSATTHVLTDVPTRVRFRVYDYGKDSYEILGGRQGALLSYSVQDFSNYLQSEVPLLPEDAYYFVLSETALNTSGSSMVHSEATIQIDEAIGSEVDLFTTMAVNSEVTLGNVGYREMQYLITNTSPATTTNREVLSRYGEVYQNSPLVDPQPQWAIDLDYRLYVHSMLMNKDGHIYDTQYMYGIDTPDQYTLGCYPSNINFWSRGIIPVLKEDGTSPEQMGWVCQEETAMWNSQGTTVRADTDYIQGAQSVLFPVQYAVDEDAIFGFFRPADGELSEQVRTASGFLDPTLDEVNEAFPCLSTWGQVSVTAQWYTMGCRLYKFDTINSTPSRQLELQDQYQDSTGVTQYFTYRHFGLDTKLKEIFVVRCKGKHNIFSMPNAYGYDTNYMRLSFQSYVDVPTWDEFYECNSTPSFVQMDSMYWPIETIEYEDNDYTERDIVVLDYDFSIKYAVGPTSIEGLQDDDVIQHVMGKNGYIFILTQVKEVAPYDWSALFSDWFNSDVDELKYYEHMQTFVTYRKARIYAVRGSLRTGIAKLLHEFDVGTFGQDNIVIQEVTDTHVWINWDGIRPFMRGPLSGMGIRLDGTGVDEVPGLVAVVKDMYEQGWQLLMYPRTEDAPTMTTSRGLKTSDSPLSYFSEFESRNQRTTFWGNLFPLDYTKTGLELDSRRKYLSHMKVLNEVTLHPIGYDGSCIINGTLDHYGNEYWVKPACQPAVSNFFTVKLYDWVASEVTLKGDITLEPPNTWISTNDGTEGVIIL